MTPLQAPHGARRPNFLRTAPTLTSRHPKRRLLVIQALGVALLALGASQLGCAESSRPGPAFGSGLPRVAPTPDIKREEHAMHARLNRDRKAQGLSPLTYDEQLADIARYHSADMRDHGFFDHESPQSGSLQDRLDAAGYLSLVARENLSEAPDIDRGQNGLLQSPPHHANIMATDITHVGIGIVPGGVHAPENLTITQVFARPGRVETPTEARSAIRKAIERARTKAGLPPVQASPLLDELATNHVESLAQGKQELERVSESVMAELSQRGSPGGGVLTHAQRLPESSTFQIPRPLTEQASVSYGLAVHPTRSDNGRPSLQVLCLVQM